MYQTAALSTEESPGIANGAGGHVSWMRKGIYGKLCLLDAKARLGRIEAEEGAATAEYAVVLVAATGFAALLVPIMKSETVRKMLLDIVKQALSVGG